LDFRPVAELNGELIDKFRDTVKKEFPVVQENIIKSYAAKFKQGEILEQEPLPDQKIYNFIDVNSENKIELGNDHIVIESFKYINFRIFSKIIKKSFDSLLNIVKDPDYTRLGLRYINQIVLSSGNPLIWTGYIDNSFTSVIDKFFERSPNLSRAMSQVVLNYDDYKLNFNYGMHNSEFPSKISRKEFILDFDFYTEYVENDAIMDLLSKFNKETAILFEKCIKEKLRNKMEVIDE
jgi:uncharacterized protein (TIGR04255 family)